jgi:hypothetical protein
MEQADAQKEAFNFSFRERWEEGNGVNSVFPMKNLRIFPA